MELTITLEDAAKRAALFGSADRHLRLIRGALGVQISARDSTLKVSGNARAVGQAASIIEDLQRLLKHRDHLTDEQVAESITYASQQEDLKQSAGGNGHTVEVYTRTANIQPRTEGQKAYIEAIRQDDLVFCVGPAGSGKTYLAVAMAISMLKTGVIRRIVLVRPAVEAGEKLGFLPGDMQAKVNPYLRPLFDAMYDMLSLIHI